jgi:catechol 2,3-dioxygenase-like lactoylglutathione lyase family enzyme
MLGTVHHIALTVTDLSTSRSFYQPILSFLGYTSLNSFPDFDLWNSPDTGATLTFWQAKLDLIDHRQFDYAPGLHHVAFTATSRQQVDRFYQLLLKLKADVVDVPAEYSYSPGYYAVFFRDPDRIRIEFVYVPISKAE